MAAFCIGAIVALPAWLHARHRRSQQLTQQLQQLFLLLSQAACDICSRRRMIEDFGRQASEPGRAMALDERVYATQTHQQILMLVRLYFPRLTKLENDLTAANSRIVALVARFGSGETIERSEINHCFHGYGQLLRRLQDEIVHHRAELVKERLVPWRPRTPS